MSSFFGLLDDDTSSIRMMVNLIGFLILKPGGHPGIVEKNVKLSMACHHSVHSPRFQDKYCLPVKKLSKFTLMLRLT